MKQRQLFFFSRIFALTFVVLILNTALIKASNYRRLIILLDDIASESIEKKELQAMVRLLDRAMKEQASPVLVSQSILFNYTVRRSYLNHPGHPENKNLADSPFFRSTWKLYRVKNTSYFLLIPVKQQSYYKFDFDSTQLVDLSLFLPLQGSFYRSLRCILKGTIAPLHLATELFKLFKPFSEKIWNFYIAGHGSNFPKNITGVSAQQINTLLNFFNENLKVKFVYMFSCFLGGPNKSHLKPLSRDGFHFHLTLGCIKNGLAVVNPDIVEFETFFNRAEKFTHPSTKYSHTSDYKNIQGCDAFLALEEVLAPVTHRATSKYSAHAMESTPLYLSPCSTSFKVISSRCTTPPSRSPSPSQLTTQEYASSPKVETPTATEASALLLYEAFYEDCIEVRVTKIPLPKETESKKHPLAAIPCLETVTNQQNFSLMQKFIPEPAWRLALIDMKQQMPNHLSPCSEFMKIFAPQNVFFPIFISMHDQDRLATKTAAEKHIHFLKRVHASNVINGYSSPFFGILRFFRDTFFDIITDESRSIFFIEQLSGFNDFSPFFELRHHPPYPPLHYNTFGSYLKKHQNAFITLENIMIITQGRLGRKNNEISVSIVFIFEGTVWHFSYSGLPENFNKNPNGWWTFLPSEKQRSVINAFKEKFYAS